MSIKNIKTRREAFEAFVRDHYWLCEMSHERDDIQPSEYVESEMNVAWEAYNAALDSICVELPESVSGGAKFPYKCYDGGWNDALAEVQEALTAAGVNFK